MPHLYPGLIFFLLVSVAPAVMLLSSGGNVRLDQDRKLVIAGFVVLSFSCALDLYLQIQAVTLIWGVSPQLLLFAIGFVPGAVLVGFGFIRWARRSTESAASTERLSAASAEIEQLQARLLQALQRAEEAEHAKAEFLANMSHGLRTPLNAIIGFSEMMHAEMLGELGSDAYKGYLQAINSSSRQLHDVISDLLDLTKVNSGQLALNKSKVDLQLLARECAALVREQVENKHIGLEETYAADTLVDADPRMLRQVFLNLLANAIKFTPDHGKITLTLLLQTDGRPVIMVKDSGVGMRREDIELATTPFEHSEGVLTRSYEGLALQLALVNTFVELHGGELFIDSKLDYGTCVTVKLPPVEAVETEIDMPSVSSVA